MASIFAFSPLGDNATVTTVAGSTTAQAIAGDSSIPANMMVHNAGATVAFIKFGPSTVAAAASTDAVLPPTSLISFAVPPGVTHCTVFHATGSTTVYVQRGNGV